MATTFYLNLDYDQLIELVVQLSEEQQQELIVRLLTQRGDQRSLTADEKIQLLQAAQLHNPVNEPPSLRREDWYGDDGR
ncbi:MAG: hypothetical protein H7175_19100 [Burkholderiales bacterium]|nr:hypothetical protein [Anaerolineae bacterium]